MALFSALVCGTWQPTATIAMFCFNFYFSLFLAIIDRDHFVFHFTANCCFRFFALCCCVLVLNQRNNDNE